MFPNLQRRTHEYRKLHASKQVLFFFPLWEHVNIYINTHRNKKRIVEISQEERGEEETHVPT
jgi:hypothetical protein